MRTTEGDASSALANLGPALRIRATDPACGLLRMAPVPGQPMVAGKDRCRRAKCGPIGVRRHRRDPSPGPKGVVRWRRPRHSERRGGEVDGGDSEARHGREGQAPAQTRVERTTELSDDVLKSVEVGPAGRDRGGAQVRRHRRRGAAGERRRRVQAAEGRRLRDGDGRPTGPHAVRLHPQGRGHRRQVAGKFKRREIGRPCNSTSRDSSTSRSPRASWGGDKATPIRTSASAFA